MISFFDSYTTPTFFDILPWVLLFLTLVTALWLVVRSRKLIIRLNATCKTTPLETVVSKESPTPVPSQAASLKASDIRRFITLSRIYQEHYDELIKLSRRKITGGQTDELLNSLKSDSITKLPQRNFLNAFDSAITEAIPDFPDKVNLLFESDKKIPHEEGHSLTPELRIAAMISLGETDSQTIAYTLGISLNTVYTYRNRLKSRATDRDGFEVSLRGFLPQ